MRSRRSHVFINTTGSWRASLQRFSFLFFIVASLSLLIVGHTNPKLIETTRAQTMDFIAPILDGLTRPIVIIEDFSAEVKNYMALHEENQKLKDDNKQMIEWQNAVAKLQQENTELHNLLNFKTTPNMTYISARVIADTGGPLVRSMIITAGKLDGVREGMGAVTGDGLVGRVIEAGDWSSRILLITDLNSRIPVMIGPSGERAILAGDNTAQPKLLYLLPDTTSAVGTRVVTSGHGGIFPPDLPVGIITNINGSEVSVTPLANLGRINYIRLIDFSLPGNNANPMNNSTKLETNPPAGTF